MKQSGAQPSPSTSALIVALATALLVARIWSTGPIYNQNDMSRWAQVHSLAIYHTFDISWTHHEGDWINLIDSFRYNGKTYSSKPPMLAVLAAGPYWLLDKLTGLNLLTARRVTSRLLLMFFNVVPFAIYLTLFARLLERRCETLWAQQFMLAAAAFGTAMSAFSMSLNNHTTGALLVFFATYLYFSITLDGRRESWRYVLIGLFSALAGTIDLTASAWALFLLIRLIAHAPRAAWLKTLPPMLLVAAAFFLTNWYATPGSLLPYQVWHPVDLVGHAYWQHRHDIDAVRESKLAYLFHTTIGHHGVFSLTPIFAFTAIALWHDARAGRGEERWFSRAVALVSVVVWTFYIFRTRNYGGASIAFRWLVWLAPLWLLSTIAYVDRKAKSARFRGLALALLGISVFSAHFPVYSPWVHPWIYALFNP